MQNDQIEKEEFEKALSELKINIPVQDVQERQEYENLLLNYLRYPSDKIADVHEYANRLGHLDVSNARSRVESLIKHVGENEICQCCSSVRQTDLKFSVKLSDIQTLGEATRLFFFNMEYSAYILVVGFIVFGIFALITNIIASRNACEKWDEYCNLNLSILALGAKLNDINDENTSFHLAQAWLGFLMCVIWVFMFFYKAGKERIIKESQRSKHSSVANFSILIQNLPNQHTIYTLQQEFNIIGEKMKEKGNFSLLDAGSNNEAYDNSLNIEVFNEVYSYRKIKSQMKKEVIYDLKQKLKEIRKQLVKIVYVKMEKQKNPPIFETKIGTQANLSQEVAMETYTDRRKIYIEFERVLEQFKRGKKAFIQRRIIIEASRIRPSAGVLPMSRAVSASEGINRGNFNGKRKTVIVTFSHNYAVHNFFPQAKSWKQRLTTFNCSGASPYSIDGCQIYPAPEPEDFIWENFDENRIRNYSTKLVTFVVSIVLLGLSFFFIYKLSEWQFHSQSVAVSILMSIFITLANLILALLIRLLTMAEKDWLTTDQQISLSIKTVIAQLINSIVLSIIANFYIKSKNMYRKGGLAEDVLLFAISQAILPPLLRYFDISYVFMFHLVKWWAKRPKNKLEVGSQIKYNKKWERLEFEIGYEYTYVLRTMIYTAFFMSLQPLISIISALGLFLMYLAQKYALLFRSKRPQPSSDRINKALNIVLDFTVCAYAFGSLTWTNFLYTPNRTFALVPNILSLCVGLLLYIIPYNRIIDYMKQEKARGMQYQSWRIFFTTEYERLNPHTREEGNQKYLEYIRMKQAEYGQQSIVPGFGPHLEDGHQKQKNFLLATKYAASPQQLHQLASKIPEVMPASRVVMKKHSSKMRQIEEDQEQIPSNGLLMRQSEVNILYRRQNDLPRIVQVAETRYEQPGITIKSPEQLSENLNEPGFDEMNFKKKKPLEIQLKKTKSKVFF